MAPSNLIPWLLADRIFVNTGMRSDVERPSFCSKLVPARLLWHPVSASTLTATVLFVLNLYDGPRASSVKSASMALTVKVIVG